MKKTNWSDLKGYQNHLIKVDELDISALIGLYDNSYRMSNDSNNNVLVATVSPDIWFDDIVDLFMKNIDYVAKVPNFQMIYLKNSELFTTVYSCDYEKFNSLNEVRDFFESKKQFSSLVLFSIVKYVDLDNLVAYWGVRYKEIVDAQQIRDKKIEYLTK
jgi:hypothetical protein